MDELSMFKDAPPRLLDNEERLLKMADLVFTGGVSLFEYKCDRHPHVFACPSGVDVAHFGRARSIASDHPDQAAIPHPRVGFAGVIDERMNLDLVRELAELRPDWQFVFVGPVVKIGSAALPQASNLHWLGKKPYDDLPQFFAGWDAALMPFALNDATRFISPTKTPEYLSAGLPVVSTPIRDVVRPYGELGLVHIADNAQQCAAALEQVMCFGMTLKWRERADAFLKTLAWDDVWAEMDARITRIAAPPVDTADTQSAASAFGQEEARV
jgi:UDP-galactopyranose mutase